jgi:hypothetical protein
MIRFVNAMGDGIKSGLNLYLGEGELRITVVRTVIVSNLDFYDVNQKHDHTVEVRIRFVRLFLNRKWIYRKHTYKF